MTEQLKQTIPTITLKPGKALPPGSKILKEETGGNRLVKWPIKYLPERDQTGLIIGWNRRPREDFI